jgi:hypothetical protein
MSNLTDPKILHILNNTETIELSQSSINEDFSKLIAVKTLLLEKCSHITGRTLHNMRNLNTLSIVNCAKFNSDNLSLAPHIRKFTFIKSSVHDKSIHSYVPKLMTKRRDDVWIKSHLTDVSTTNNCVIL